MHKNRNPFLVSLTLLAAILISIATEAKPNIENYVKCFESLKANVESSAEREFLSAYLSYLKFRSQKNGRVVIDSLLKLQQAEGEKYRSATVGLFEGSAKLCCETGCSYSMGSATRERLWPKVKSGDATAVEIVLMYSTLIGTDGAESESLRDYQKVVRKHDKQVKRFINKYDEILKTHSINWLD